MISITSPDPPDSKPVVLPVFEYLPAQPVKQGDYHEYLLFCQFSFISSLFYYIKFKTTSINDHPGWFSRGLLQSGFLLSPAATRFPPAPARQSSQLLTQIDSHMII
jgi:hypothetical protein